MPNFETDRPCDLRVDHLRRRVDLYPMWLSDAHCHRSGIAEDTSTRKTAETAANPACHQTPLCDIQIKG